MAITFILELKGVGAAELDEAARRLDVSPGKVPPGQIAHVETVTDDGAMIIDVWDSEEAFGQFMQEKLGPLMADGVIPTLDPPAMHQVHRVFVNAVGAASR